MVIKDILTGETAHQKVYSGIFKLAKAVGDTFGPSGHPVSLMKDNGDLHCTKDGVSVAREITFADQVEYCATTYIKDIANNTVARAGDGTTTAILLAQKLYAQGRDEKGKELVKITPSLIKGMKEASNLVVSYLNSIAIPAKNPDILEKVALVASNNDTEISSLLKEAMEVLGDTGNIYVEESKSTKTKLFTSPGMGIMKGFASNHFINNSKRLSSDLILPYVLITEDEIYSIFQLQNIFNQLTEYHRELVLNPDPSKGERPPLTDVPHLLIVCKKMKEDVLEWAITQHAYSKSMPSRGIQLCVIQADHISESTEQVENLMNDLRLITGCQGIGGKFLKRLGTGVAQCNRTDLGRLKKSVVNNEKSILIPLKGNLGKVNEFCEGLKAQLEAETDDDIKPILRSRISRLSDGVAILSIGGITEKSVKERADRIEDAVCAVMVAREHGVLPGGGLPYLFASAYLLKSDLYNNETNSQKDDEFRQGLGIVGKALCELTISLLEINHQKIEDLHSDLSGKYEEVYNNPSIWKGINLRTGEIGVNLFEEGILDPVKVNIEAIQNAVDIISMLLNTNSFVIYADEQEKKQIYPPKGLHNNPMLGFGNMANGMALPLGMGMSLNRL